MSKFWQREWGETGLVSNKFLEILPKLPDKLLSFCNTRKENTVLTRLHIGHSYLTHSFILRKEEAPVCVACNACLLYTSPSPRDMTISRMPSSA